MLDCLFCKIIKGEIPSRTVYEDDLIKVIMPLNLYGLPDKGTVSFTP